MVNVHTNDRSPQCLYSGYICRRNTTPEDHPLHRHSNIGFEDWVGHTVATATVLDAPHCGLERDKHGIEHPRSGAPEKNNREITSRDFSIMNIPQRACPTHVSVVARIARKGTIPGTHSHRARAHVKRIW